MTHLMKYYEVLTPVDSDFCIKCVKLKILSRMTFFSYDLLIDTINFIKTFQNGEIGNMFS